MSKMQGNSKLLISHGLRELKLGKKAKLGGIQGNTYI